MAPRGEGAPAQARPTGSPDEDVKRPSGIRSEQRFAQLIDTAPDAIVVVEPDGRIGLVNLQTEKIFGYSRVELLGQHVELLIPKRFLAGHMGHLAGFFESPEALVMGPRLELLGRRKDGTELPIEVSLSPIRSQDGITVSAAIRDITERRRLEATARLLGDRLASAVQSMQDGFALFDDKDRLVLCNSVYRRLVGEALTGPLVGMPYEQLLDVWLADLTFEDEAARSRFRAERLAPGEQTTTFDVRTRDGRSLRTMTRRTPEGGLVKTVWDTTRDVRLAAELREARISAEAASSAKSEFLSSMSHELRTPLNAILGFAELLHRDRKEPLSHRHKARTDQILLGGQHLLRLIDDILDLSRIEAGAVSVSTEPVSVSDVLEEVRLTLRPMAASLRIRIELVGVSAELPAVAADRTRLVQILMNFGSNAIKYNRRDGSVFFVVSVASESRLRVTVRDTGTGIPMDRQDCLFQPFQRAGQETGPIQGTGIGLVITKRLAELMRGEVGFRSVPTEGSEFWVDLPLHALPVRSVAPTSLDGVTRFAELGKKLVLYVEDNPANVTFMQDLLSDYDNIELLTAQAAEMGLGLARGRCPDVIILDVNLPGVSGVEALRALRAHPGTMNVPVIALTAAAAEHDRQRGRLAGFHRYLTKPVKVDELLGALEVLLAQSA